METIELEEEKVYSSLDLRIRATTDYDFNSVLEIKAVRGGELLIKVEDEKKILIMADTVRLEHKK